MDPVELVITQTCHYKAKPCKACGKPKSNPVHRSADKGGTCTFRRQVGCAVCGAPKKDLGHLGAPPSFNVMAGGDPNIYRSLKEQWEEALLEALRATSLPAGLERVVVEGEATFPDRQDRDQGNYRVVIEKALGDALQAGGYIDNDDWSRYEFGGLAHRYERGVSRTRLLLFPGRRQVLSDDGTPDLSHDMTLFEGAAA